MVSRENCPISTAHVHMSSLAEMGATMAAVVPGYSKLLQ